MLRGLKMCLMKGRFCCTVDIKAYYANGLNKQGTAASSTTATDGGA
jgi:hypothetical protein